MFSFAGILGLITGLAGPISNAVASITNLKQAQVVAQSDKDRQLINQQIQEAEARKAVLIAEAGNRVAGALNASMRFSIASFAAILLGKLLVWDKVIGSFAHCAGRNGNLPGCETFTTDALDTNQWWVITAVIGFYFLYDMMSKSRR